MADPGGKWLISIIGQGLAGLPRRLSFFVTLAVFSSAEDALWLRDSLPSHRIPDELIQRLEQAPDAEQEGEKTCAEQIQQLAAIPGINGVHLVATRNLATVNAAIELAGFGPA